MTAVAFIGLGTMGFHMAGHLACEGHQVCVYNRTAAKAELWCEEFAGESAATPREAVDGVMTYRFVANPPVTPMPQGTPWSAGIEAAAFISAYDLDSIREITVISATNQRSSRR